mmetsp:Transcript_22638/g.77026  ORF Transcript_22638/g.77026 Transcript_22638/m.77026 type:complete len:207 (-) Transcript_22638:523-1143(-)
MGAMSRAAKRHMRNSAALPAPVFGVSTTCRFRLASSSPWLMKRATDPAFAASRHRHVSSLTSERSPPRSTPLSRASSITKWSSDMWYSPPCRTRASPSVMTSPTYSHTKAPSSTSSAQRTPQPLSLVLNTSSGCRRPSVHTHGPAPGLEPTGVPRSTTPPRHQPRRRPSGVYASPDSTGSHLSGSPPGADASAWLAAADTSVHEAR